MNPTLYYAPGACSLAVHVVLEWIGKPYAAVAVNQHAADYKAINPAGAVPALDMGDGVILTQVDAILHYLARRHPEANLLDDRTLQTAAELDRWASFLTGDLHPAFFPVFSPHRYTISHDLAALEAVRSAGVELVRSKLVLLDHQLAGRSWVTGDKRTILDAYALPMLNWSQAKLPTGLAAFPSIASLHQRLLRDAAVPRVMIGAGLLER